ncbi:hypothetical protein P4O66_003346 [Electrophorus voltai]|uniref:Uncharacterized protein n=1 Tax=Electrophorus voltai TaxID=2609070 RepID=A0AAD8YR11_9TELE|nr:hypothetical protein P4O66_003346 [Electrophorus voltai]
MEHYIQEALAQGYICPSTLSASASIKEMDDGLRPCKDYRGLNALSPRSVFVFQVSYRPGLRNVKADTLSQDYRAEALPTSLPLSYILGAVSRDLDCGIAAENPHPHCTLYRLYNLPRRRIAPITWAHTSLGSAHPGSTGTSY